MLGAHPHAGQRGQGPDLPALDRVPRRRRDRWYRDGGRSAGGWSARRLRAERDLDDPAEARGLDRDGRARAREPRELARDLRHPAHPVRVRAARRSRPAAGAGCGTPGASGSDGRHPRPQQRDCPQEVERTCPDERLSWFAAPWAEPARRRHAARRRRARRGGVWKRPQVVDHNVRRRRRVDLGWFDQGGRHFELPGRKRLGGRERQHDHDRHEPAGVGALRGVHRDPAG